MLRNKSHTTDDDSVAERDEREKKFFLDSAWNALNPWQLGIEPLRNRLRDALWKKIKEGLPGVKSEVQSGIKDCQSKLGQLGKARSTRKEKHAYLHRISSRLSTMVRAAIDGVYADPFFESFHGQDDSFERRLRAAIQKILAEYSGEMRDDGHALEVVEDNEKPTRLKHSKCVMRKMYLKEVQKLMIECKGRELPGTFNPLVVGDLFSRQCKPWELITQRLVEVVHEAAATTFNKMVSQICDSNTKSRLMKGLIQPSLYQVRKDLKQKIDELLKPHLSIHPITYNDDLTDNVQEIQAGRHNRSFDKLLRDCGYVETDDGSVDLDILVEHLRQGTRPDVEKYSASLAADVAAAYYKVFKYHISLN